MIKPLRANEDDHKEGPPVNRKAGMRPIYKNYKQMKLIIIILLFLLNSCNKNNNYHEPLKLINKYPLEIEEPAGLSQSHLQGFLFTVCDNNGTVYLIDKKGVIEKIFFIDGDDLEGVEYVEEDSLIYVVEERKRWVLSLDLEGNRLDTFKLDNIPVININDGPEGISYNPKREHFYIVNEKNPGRLYVYNKLFDLVSEHHLGFAGDYSSVEYEQQGDNLWILSDDSKIIARCDLKGEPEQIYSTGLPKGEGVHIDIKEQLIYIVCNDTSFLYVFEMP